MIGLIGAIVFIVLSWYVFVDQSISDSSETKQNKNYAESKNAMSYIQSKKGGKIQQNRLVSNGKMIHYDYYGNAIDNNGNIVGNKFDDIESKGTDYAKKICSMKMYDFYPICKVPQRENECKCGLNRSHICIEINTNRKFYFAEDKTIMLTDITRSTPRYDKTRIYWRRYYIDNEKRVIDSKLDNRKYDNCIDLEMCKLSNEAIKMFYY